MVRPSGLTSREIQVPCEVVKRAQRAGASGRATLDESTPTDCCACAGRAARNNGYARCDGVEPAQNACACLSLSRLDIDIRDCARDVTTALLLIARDDHFLEVRDLGHRDIDCGATGDRCLNRFLTDA
jgi:hypothetical protein